MTDHFPCRLARAARLLLLCAGQAVATLAAAAESVPEPVRLPAGIEACAQVRVDAERLLCYDKFVAPNVKGAAMGPVAPGSTGTAAGAPPTAAARDAALAKPAVDDRGSYLDEFWELTPERKRGTFNFLGYRPNYVLPAHYSTRVNTRPTSPAPGHDAALPDYKSTEAKLQFSLRTKLWENLLLPGGDLWAAYTDQSLWQVYSGGISRPFRSDDHEPELFYVLPARYDLPLGFRTKMVGLGIAHQSNAQSLPQSRSWNRYYALAGLENGNFALTARFNQRIGEGIGQDDNPDLTRYRGKTELLGQWTPGFVILSALVKTNFNSRGSLQLDYSMPVDRKDPKGLRWYVQAFTGYGETLIDYNFRQTSFGVGLSLFGF